MHPALRGPTALLLTGIFSVTSLTTGCKSPQGGTQSAPQSLPQNQQADTQTTPLSVDDLVAPIALYPDQLLAQVLTASTNPQEVLDGGNWIIQNQNLKGDALTSAAKTAGFGPSMQYLMNFPQVVDNMCQEMDWTTQLGQAFQSDQKGVMEAVQRKRGQAQQAGNLSSSPQMSVETKTDNGQQYVEIKPADPKVVYVPQYNPVTIYNTQAAPAAAPAPSTTTTTASSGVSTGTAVGIGLLSFGVGMALGAAISNNNHYYPYPAWGYHGVYYGGRPYYPPPYRPAYPGYHPAYGYHPPPSYQWNQVNRNVNVNVNNNYYNKFNNQNRSSTLPANNRLGQSSTYQGARPATVNQKPGASMANAVPRNQQLAARSGSQPANVNRPEASNRAAAGNRATSAGTARVRHNTNNAGSMNRSGAPLNTQPVNRGGDRGYADTSRASNGMSNTGAVRSTPSTPTQNRVGGGASVFGGGSARSDQAASRRGRSSMRAPASGRVGGSRRSR